MIYNNVKKISYAVTAARKYYENRR